jgi:hypothetical protein
MHTTKAWKRKLIKLEFGGRFQSRELYGKVVKYDRTEIYILEIIVQLKPHFRRRERK